MAQSFGKWLHDWRERAGMKQVELARRLEVSPTYISNLERDISPSAKTGRPQPSRDFVDRLAKALRVPIAEARLAAGYAPPESTAERPGGAQMNNMLDRMKIVSLKFGRLPKDKRAKAEAAIDALDAYLDKLEREE